MIWQVKACLPCLERSCFVFKLQDASSQRRTAIWRPGAGDEFLKPNGREPGFEQPQQYTVRQHSLRGRKQQTDMTYSHGESNGTLQGISVVGCGEFSIAVSRAWQYPCWGAGSKGQQRQERAVRGKGGTGNQSAVKRSEGEGLLSFSLFK